MRKLIVALAAGALALAAGGPLAAQGTGVQFVNFEAPAHKPIAVVNVGEVPYLLVANGPDNSVELYTTNQPPTGLAPHQFIQRIAVGQRPVTVAVKERPTEDGARQVYVANWLGDSVTVFDLVPRLGATPPVLVRMVGTEPVGDEPVGITFLPENPNDPATLPGGSLHELVFVTFSAQQGWGMFRPGTLLPVINPATAHLELLTPGDPTFGVRDPRAIAWAPPPAGGGAYQDEVWILNFRGGNNPGVYDLDLWGTDDLVNAVVNETSTLPTHGGFGTTNFNMAFARNGDLWVVGILARNRDPALTPSFIDAVGEPIHQAMAVNETGFTVSFLARHTDLSNASLPPDFLDLNDSSQGAANPPTQAAVPVTQPTDVVVYGSGEPGGTRVFVTGFNSDTLAAVEPTAGAPATWTVHRIAAAHPTNAFSLANLGGIMRGPRGLALKASTFGSSRDRLYVYNRVNNSVTVVDPNFTSAGGAVLSNFPLQFQVEPAHVTAGRKLLYSSALSAAGNVSCAVCHIDGNTDFLAWNLADGMMVPTPGDPNGLPDALGPNADRKGPMVVQPLRGLVNFEVVPGAMQDTFYSNRPYHWRGDRGFVEQFNGAFVNLMGAPNITPNPPNPLFHAALPASDMTLYRNFIFSIHYPPNPREPWERVYSGDLGDPDDPATGSLAQLGLKGFLTTNSDGPVNIPVTCENCHALPEGSNNLLTETLGNTQSQSLPGQSLETAQTKALFLKEKRLLRVVNGAFVQPHGLDVITHEFGLIHTGESTIGGFGSNTINDFVSGFAALLDPVSPNLRDGISHYLREFDSGVAPLVGFTVSLTVPEYGGDPAGLQASLAGLEQQRLAINVGIAIHARVNGVLRGFWYDVTDPNGKPYHEEPQTGLATIGPFSSSELLDLLDATLGVDPTNLLTFHFTPLGSSRRVAHIQGGLAPAPAGGAPANVQLLPSPTMSANAAIPSMVAFWQSQVNNFIPFIAPTNLRQAAAEVHYQVSLVNHAPNGFGLTQIRREAPRRFRLSGEGFLDGAFALIYAPSTADIASAPSAGSPPTTTPNAGANPFFFLLPIYPGRDGQGALIWETAAELDSTLMLALLNGATANPVAVTAFFDPLNLMFFNATGYVMSTTDLMQPTVNNWYYAQGVNFTATGPQVSTGSWQRLTITP